jgi:hypothetical protein
LSVAMPRSSFDFIHSSRAARAWEVGCVGRVGGEVVQFFGVGREVEQFLRRAVIVDVLATALPRYVSF